MKIRQCVLCAYFLFGSLALAAQASPDLTFGGHALGEPADIFFSKATTVETKELTIDYCKSLLEDPKVKEKVQQRDSVDKNGGVFVLHKKDFSVLDVDNCRQVQAALKGEQANVGARLASELGKGGALFAYGRLSAFNLSVDSSYSETVSDLERRFGFAGQKDTVARVGWPPLQEVRWEKDGVLAAVWRNEFTGGAVLIVGLLEPPYDSFLRGTIIPASSLPATRECNTSDSAKKVRISPGVIAGLKLHDVAPVYPETAKQNGIAGVVVLSVTIDECGAVAHVTPISGAPELIPAAVTAVRQWRYRPFISSGQAVVVETQLRINFTLSH